MKNDNTLLVSSSYISHAISFLEKRGVATEEYCVGSNIDKESLQARHAFLPLQNVRAFYASVMVGEGIPELGLMLGREHTITSHGLAGIAAISQRNFYECLVVCSQLISFRFPAISASVIEGDTHFSLRLDEVVPLGKGMPFAMELATSVVHGIDKMLFPEGEESCFRFGYKLPSYADRYSNMFGCYVEFDSEFNEILFPNYRKKQFLSYHDPANATLFLNEFLNDVPLVNKCNIYKRILSILQASEGKLFDQEEVSNILSLSPRSLRRKLRESGSTFQELVNIVKKKYAIHCLMHTSMTITEISAFLYYNDSSHFTKAFKSWVGVSPSGYRNIRSGAEKGIVKNISTKDIATLDL